jgi:hypothetical protein
VIKFIMINKMSICYVSTYIESKHTLIRNTGKHSSSSALGQSVRYISFDPEKHKRLSYDYEHRSKLQAGLGLSVPLSPS